MFRRIFARDDGQPLAPHRPTPEERWLCDHCPARTHGMCEIGLPIGCADRDIVDSEVYCGVYHHVVPYDEHGMMIGREGA
jgi:hypothetical protein